jgi:hypothetical protein
MPSGVLRFKKHFKNKRIHGVDIIHVRGKSEG